MSDEVYERVAEALNRLPNGFPRTPSNVEIPLLKKLFTPEEAEIAAQLGREWEPVDAIAERLGVSTKEAISVLMKMLRRGQVWLDKRDGKSHFRLAPFAVGLYEAQLESLDHEMVHLVEEYFADGGVEGIMKPQPALHRVMPAHGSVKSEWVLPYDDVKALLLSAKRFNVRDCICRVQQDMLGTRKCDLPLAVCLSFGTTDGPTRAGDISQEEALRILDLTEEVGLVHTVSNVMEGLNYICNCCGCCCGILRGVTEFGAAESIAHANYYAVIDPDECMGCLTCMERCQVDAISLQDEYAVVDREKCIGCGLCVTGCPDHVAKLERKPDDEIVHPPADFTTWEEDRLRSRGLSE